VEQLVLSLYLFPGRHKYQEVARTTTSLAWKLSRERNAEEGSLLWAEGEADELRPVQGEKDKVLPILTEGGLELQKGKQDGVSLYPVHL